MTRFATQLLGDVLDFYDHQRVPISSLERDTMQGEFRYYGAQGVIDHINAYLFDGQFILVAEDGANLVTRNEPVAFLVHGQFWVNNHAHVIKGKVGVADDFYVTAMLNSMNIAGFITGAAQPKLSQQNLKKIQISLPDYKTQRQIAEVLSAYDDLMENNRRRMALLEESARLLYREWFVRLRFPGHEHTRKTANLPAGWMVTDLATVCLPKIGIQTGPFGSQLHQSDYSEDGIPVVMPKDIDGSRISTESVARVPEEICQRLSRHVLDEGDIVLARRGDIGRKAIIAQREIGWMCGTGCMRLRPNSQIVDPRFLFTTIGREDVVGVIASRAQGAIMPNLNLGMMADIPLTLPPKSLQELFLDFVGPTHRQIDVLQAQNEKLRAARDLLLPRLMAGEVTV